MGAAVFAMARTSARFEMSDVISARSTQASAMARPVAAAGTLSATGLALTALGATVWTAVVGSVAVWRHDHFLSHRFDLGNMVQAVWSTTQGRPLDMTDGSSGEQIVRLGAHVDPILVLFAPLWWVAPHPETLIVAYVAIIAAGIYPVVRLALKHTESGVAAGLLGAWYLTYPWTIWIAFNELNPVMLSLPLLLYAIWFLDEHRLARFAVAAVLAMLTGELIGLTVAGLGVWYALKHARRRTGLAIAAAGTAWTAICIAVVIPAFNGGGSSRYYGHFEKVGGTPLGVLETLFTDPGAIIAQLATAGDLAYLLWLAVPTAFLFVGQPLLLVMTVPQLGVNLVASAKATVAPQYHYSAPIIAALFAASIMAVGRLPARRRALVACVPLMLSVALLSVIHPVPGSESYLFPTAETPARLAALREATALVPAGAPITVTNRVGAHLSDRRTIHLFPARNGATWAVLDTRDPSNVTANWIGPIPFAEQLRRLDRDPGWRLVFEKHGVRVYRTVG